MPSERERPATRLPGRRRLIVNADDLGLTTEITDAILASHVSGVVTSTSLLVNLPGSESAAAKARAHPSLAVGVHLNLTTGRPLADLGESTLVDSRGALLEKHALHERARIGRLDPEDVRHEMRAQMLRAIELGIRPTHVDGHNGVDRIRVVEEAILELALELRVRAVRTHFGWARVLPGATLADRARCAVRNVRDGERLRRAWQSRQRFRRRGLRTSDGQVRRMRVYPSCPERSADVRERLAHLGPGTWEWIVHPAPREDGTGTEFAETRQADFDLVRDPEVAAMLSSEEIDLISYRDL